MVPGISEHLAQELPGVGIWDPRDLLGCSDGHNPTAFVAPFGSHVDDPVGRAHHIQVVLDDHHGIAAVDQAVENFEELAGVLEVEAGGGFVEDVHRAAGSPFAQLGGELDPLSLATGQSWGRLAETDVPQPHVVDGLEDASDGWLRLEEDQSFLNRHVQYVGYRASLPSHFERVPVVAAAVAHFARDVDIGEEVHLDLDIPVAPTRLAAATADVEGEAPGQVAAGSGLRSDENSFLIRSNSLVYVAALDRGVRPMGDWSMLITLSKCSPPSMRRWRPGTARERYNRWWSAFDRISCTRDDLPLPDTPVTADEHAQRKGNVDLTEVVLGRPHDRQRAAISRSASVRRRDSAAAGQVVAGQRRGFGDDLGDTPLRHHVTAALPRPGSEIDDIVGGADGLLIVLDHDQGVTQVPEAEQGLEEASIVALV